MSSSAPAPSGSRWIVALLGLLFGLGAGAYVAWRLLEPEPGPDPLAVVAANNRGIGLMEQFRYDEAAAAFEEVVRLDPTWLPGHINLGIALLNTTDENRDKAITIFRDVLERDPDNLHAHFCLGIIHKHRGQAAEAYPHFKRVTELDPKDDRGWLNCGVTHPDGEHSPAALECFEKALRLNPYLGTARYKVAFHPKNEARRKELLESLEALKRAKWEAADDLAYTAMGKYAEVIGRNPRTDEPPTGPLPMFRPDESFSVQLTEGAAWAKPEQLGELRELLRQRFGAAVVLLDIDGDDLPDVFLPGAVAQGGAVRDLLLRNGGGGKFTDVTAEAGLAGGRASLGGCAADFDNDGHTDLLITRAGGVSLFRNTGDGKFEDKTAAAGLDSLTGVFLGCAALDLDQDSDLDLALARYAGDEAGAVAGLKGGEAPGGGLVVLAHVGEAPPAEPGQQRGPLGLRFRPVEGQEALAIQGPVANVTVTDIDDDRDVDLVVWADGRPGAILRNDRLMRFSRAGEAIGSEGQRANGALAMDADHDERPDRFVVLAGAAPRLLLSPDDAAPGAVAFRDGAAVAPPLRQAQAIDLDLDGWTDVAAVAADGRFVFLHNDGRGKLARRSDDLGPPARGAPGDDLLAAAAADLDGDGYPDLLRFSAARGLTAWKNLGNGNHGLRLVLTGVRDPAPDGAMRTNADGIGTWVEAQAGVTWTGMENTTLAAGLGRSRLPLWLGIGAADRAGFVRVRWPDMVPQGEFDVAAGRVVRLRETDRRADSCPVLFAWDGERFAYVTDCLGAGALGELNPDGSVRPPRPEESVKIEPGRLVPRGGQYLVKIAEPMNEVLYLDRVELLAVDHPAEVDVFPDERFAFAGPAPTGELFAFRERIFPVSARDHRGRDVTELLRHRDGRFADGFARRAWLGFAEEHFVELDFGDRLAQIPGDRRLVLVLAGGTVYPYPEALHAAGQAGVAYLPPVLEQLGEDGRWRAVAELGIPAGLPRVMTREVTGLPGGGGGRLRIRTNARVFWDQVFLAPLLESSANPARVRELGPASASLAARGFAQEVLRPGSPFPEYEDARTEPVAVTPWQGRLTRLGDVTPLLTETDDRFVVTGPGDAVTAAFDAGSLPPLPEGWRRSFVLRLNGYCKSVSPYILTGGRVGPLPFRGMTRYPYGPDEHHPDPAYQREWNTRRPGR